MWPHCEGPTINFTEMFIIDMCTFSQLSYQNIPIHTGGKYNKPGRVIRCVSQAEIVLFGGISLMVTDGHTDGHTDGRTLL